MGFATLQCRGVLGWYGRREKRQQVGTAWKIVA